MTTRNITRAITIGVLISLVIWDFYAYYTAGDPGTISRVVLAWSSAHPSITLLIGVLVGHLLLPQNLTETEFEENLKT